MRIGSDRLAAKRFFNIGDGKDHVVKEDNHQHLKEELLRQAVAALSVARFMEAAKAANVSVYSELFETE